MSFNSISISITQVLAIFMALVTSIIEEAFNPTKELSLEAA